MNRADAALRVMTAVSAVMLLYIACVTPIGWIDYYGAFHVITTLLGAVCILGLAAGAALLVRRMKAMNDASVIATTIILAIVLRGAWVALVDTTPTSDFLEYHRYATAVAQGDVRSHGWFFIVFPFKVVYALILGGIYSVTTAHPTIAGAVNIVASCGMVLMMYTVTRRWYDRSVACAAALLAAIWPLQIAFTSVAAQEHIFLVLYLCVVAAMLALPRRTHVAQIVVRALIIGACIAVANLFRPVAVIAFPVLVLYVWAWRWRDVSRRWVYRTVTVGTALCAFVVSTSLFNIPIERITGIDINKARPGFSIYVGTHAPSHGMWFPESYNLVYRTAYNADTVHQRSMEAAMQQITADPIGMVILAVEKFHYFWASGEYAVMYATREMGQRGMSPWIAAHHTSALVASQAMYAVLIALAGVALWRRRRQITELDGIVVTTFLVHVACFTILEIQSRYHMVVELILLIPAATLLAGRTHSREEHS